MAPDTHQCQICGRKATSLTICKSCGKQYCNKCQSPSTSQEFCRECVSLEGVVTKEE